MKAPVKLLDGSDDDFGVFARGAIICSQVTAWFLGFDSGQHQRPAALGARLPESVDELKIQRVCHGGSRNAFTSGIASQFRFQKGP
jgi:hypothetical protein